MCQYLTDLPSDVCNEYGLSKVLLTRRDTIRLKHLQKNLFCYNNQENLEDMLKFMQFKGVIQYFEYLTNQLRGIYKYPRDFTSDNVDNIVKQRKGSFIDTIKMYKSANPIVILDFDKTITNKRFHPLYKHLIQEGYYIIINSANPNLEAIEYYIEKHELGKPNKIYANKGKQKKVVKLKTIKAHYHNRPTFYIDDEDDYLTYGNLLFMICYKYTKDGKIKLNTVFEK